MKLNSALVILIVACVTPLTLAGEVSPEEILRYFPGKWKWTRADGASGSVDWKLVADGKALSGTGMSSFGGNDFGMGGWEAEPKAWVHSWFTAKSGYGRMEWTSHEGDEYKGTIHFTEPGAPAVETSVSCRIIDHNTFVLAVTADNTATWKRQSAAGPADPNLKPAARFLGSWNVTFDWPNMPFKQATVSYHWTLDGKYLYARWQDVDGADIGPEVFTWDPAKEAIRMWGFDTQSFYEAEWHIDGNNWKAEYNGTRFNGETFTDIITLEFEGATKITAKLFPEGAQEPVGTATFTKTGEGK